MFLYKRCGAVKHYLKAKRICCRCISVSVVKRNYEEEECVFSNGEVLKIGCGKLAKLSDGCATVTYKNSTVISTAVSKPRPGSQSFVPLTVSYQHKAAALGRIPSNFFRREIGQSELEILTSRLIDRSVRSSFDEGFNWETQIICSPLALDGSVLPDFLSINAASAALAISDIPWDGPVGTVRVGLKNNEVLINPTKKELIDSTLNLIVTARSKKLVVMLEGSAENVLISDLGKAIKQGAKECNLIIQAINKLRAKCGKTKRGFTPKEYNNNFKCEIESLAVEKLQGIFQNHTYDKLARDEAIKKVFEGVMNELKEKFDAETLSTGNEIFYKICKEVFKELTMNSGIRCDGRTSDKLRPISCEVELYPPLHGSALFQRGQTQVLCTVALDSPNSAMKIDQISMATSGLKEKNFFVHYQFPPYATKDVSRLGPIGRREVGHGSLAEKALRANIPKNYDFTIRLTSEVLESNGSSSMATVCAGSMALMDAGVPVLHACAGVAVGIMTKYQEEDPQKLSKYVLLTDILGIEDYFGDMDFKIAGTKKAITALQLDMKVKGLDIDVIMHSLSLGKEAIKEILVKMDSVISKPKIWDKYKMPCINKVNVPSSVRAKFLGPGGFNLKKLEMNTGAEITEESPGCFRVFATSEAVMEEVMETLNNLLKSLEEPTLEFGGIYTAVVTEIRGYGVMVTLYSTMTPALVPLSQLDQRKINHPSALGLKVGDEIKLKYFGRDPVTGGMRLSRKVLLSVPSDVQQSLHKKEGDEECKQEKRDSEQLT